MDTDFPYRFHEFEPGVFVEIYLPKKAKFQGTLYDTLTKGFNFDNVKDHFLSSKKSDIWQFLEKYGRIRDYSEERINVFPELFWGYSVYEVDGVFRSNASSSRIIEEKTQVIRVMFFPNLDHIANSCKFSGNKKKLRAYVESFLIADRETRADLRSCQDDFTKNVAEYVDSWMDYVGLFLFGYVLYEICARINMLTQKNEIDPEEEIWLTSFWNLHVNKIKLNR